MKKLLLAATLTLTAAPAMASEGLKSLMCPIHYDLAEQVMKSRQNGMSMKRQYEIAGGTAMKQMVENAYNRPRFHTKSMQEREVGEFANAAFRSCLKAYREDI